MDTSEKIGWALLCTTVTFLIFLVFYFAVIANTPTIGYSLGAVNGSLVIVKEIDNACDNVIPLINIDYNHAAALIDSLNKSLPKYK